MSWEPWTDGSPVKYEYKNNIEEQELYFTKKMKTWQEKTKQKQPCQTTSNSLKLKVH